MKRVFVAGAGLMGHGIAQVHAIAGIEVDLYEPVRSTAEAGRELIGASLDRSVARGNIEGPARDLALDRIHVTARLQDVAAAELGVEAVYEDLEVKSELFRALDAVASSSCVL